MILPLRCVGIDVSELVKRTSSLMMPSEFPSASPTRHRPSRSRWRVGDVAMCSSCSRPPVSTTASCRVTTTERRHTLCPHQSCPRSRLRPCHRTIGKDRCDRCPHARRLRTHNGTPAASQAPNPRRNALALRAKRRDQLVQMRAQEKTRRSEAQDRAMIQCIARHIDFLTGEIKAIEAEIKALIKAEPEIFEQARMMRSAPGVGPVACMQLIAQMPELGQLGPKQIAALAGLAPRNVDSGTYRGKRTIGWSPQACPRRSLYGRPQRRAP